MTEQTIRKSLWSPPWSFAESIIVVTGLVLSGFALQLFLGYFDFSILAWPVNIISGGALVVLLLLISFGSKSKLYQWLSGVPFTISLLSALMLLTIVMGLTPQQTGSLPEKKTVLDLLGFTRMTTSWPFVIIYLFTLVALGTVIIKRLKVFRWKDYAFHLNHIGLWIFLFAAGLGHADMRRYVMYVQEDTDFPEWRVYSDKGDVLELPVAIRLKDFILEEYTPSLAVVDRKTGKAIPEGEPAYFHIDAKQSGGSLQGWDIRVEKYLGDALRMNNEAYQPITMPGSCPAALVTATEKATGKVKKGWISCGNFAQPDQPLQLSARYSLEMTRPEPKRFASDIEVFTKAGASIGYILEVNKPLKIEDWTIYQYGYDNNMGKASNYSSFELVYDPWLNIVYAGMGLFAVGSLCLFWLGRKKKGEKKNDNLG